MRFPLNLYLFTGLLAALTSALALPLWRSACGRLGLIDNPGHRKIHSRPTPLAGGLTIWTALVLPSLLIFLLLKSNWLDSDTCYKVLYGVSRRKNQLAALLFGATAMLLLGALDDRRELRPAAKFVGQLVIATLVAASGMRITLFVPSLAFSYAITILWILTVINAFNFIDNMNGLCAGLGFIATVLFGLVAALHGQYLVASIAFLVSGALLGFLPYNFPRGTVFLGDSGSHLLGFLLAVIAILPHFYTRQHPLPWAVVSPLLILAVPLVDLAWVVILRWRMGQPFYVGDNNHLSNRLVRRGLTPAQTVLLVWLFAAAIGGLAFIWR